MLLNTINTISAGVLENQDTKIYDTGFQRNRDYKFRVCDKDSIPFLRFLTFSLCLRTQAVSIKAWF